MYSVGMKQIKMCKVCNREKHDWKHASGKEIRAEYERNLHSGVKPYIPYTYCKQPLELVHDMGICANPACVWNLR